jgi:hypothetical protein
MKVLNISFRLVLGSVSTSIFLTSINQAWNS